MNANNMRVTNGKWGVGATSTWGEPGVTLQVYISHHPDRFGGGQYRWQKGDAYGMAFETHEQADEYAMEHGYTKRYGRNTIRFVMSRAARKRGMTTEDRSYNAEYKRACWIGAV